MDSVTRQSDRYLDHRLIRRPDGSCLRRVIVLALLLAGGSLLCPATAQGQSRVDKLKAVYLFNFGNYIQWPDKAFKPGPAAEQKFVIGVLGTRHPVQAVLKAIGSKKKVGQRTLDARMIPDVKADWSCQILFIPETCPPGVVAAALKKVKDKPVLVVGETPDFASPKNGGMIEFFLAGNTIRFRIRPKAIAADKMKASAKILQIGVVLEE